MIAAKNIDIKDYILSGEGANGKSYECISDPMMMVKLYDATYPIQPIIDELEVAKKVYALGIPSPEPGELVTDGQRLGIRFRCITGKRSFSRMFADEPERTEEFAREMARWCKKIHAITLPEGMFPNAKDQLRQMLSQLKGVTEEERSFLGTLIDEMPDATTALHGDMHFGNIVTTLPKGAPLCAEHETYFIDLGYFAQGHPMIDLGMMSNICVYSSEEFVFHDMHIHRTQARKVYDYFIDEYFFAEDKIAQKWFGPSETAESINERLRKSFCVKSILVAYNIGNPLPEFVDEIHALMSSH